ncbi:hypothetical protein EI94DRAFT_1706417 [Lactarius quietus]|nr:hypothetical protein EI94DRAFT_1706417 [Lactarius quietus]
MLAEINISDLASFCYIPRSMLLQKRSGNSATEIIQLLARNVSTYKDVCNALGSGSPSTVGGALRNNSNPFAPLPLRIKREHAEPVTTSKWLIPYLQPQPLDFLGFSLSLFTCRVAASRAKGEWASEAPVGRKKWHRPFRGGGMGPLQDEEMRMLLCEDSAGRLCGSKFGVAEEDTDEWYLGIKPAPTLA